MKKIEWLYRFGIMTTFLVLVTTGCGKQNDKTIKDAIQNSTDEWTENAQNTDPNAQNDGNDQDSQNADSTSNNAMDVDIEGKNELSLCTGTYQYLPGDESENRTFEISRIGGNFYLEYMGNYDYAGAEIEVIGAGEGPNQEGKSYDVVLYPFSGFSFMGEYWGAGYTGTISEDASGNLTISKGQPFLDGEELLLQKKDGAAVHMIAMEAEQNMTCKEVIGTWRCISERDDERHEITINFEKNGAFHAVDKVQDQVPAVYVGKYEIDQSEGDPVGTIACERLAYGSMPFEWVLQFDTEKGCPVIYEEYTFAEPFTYKEEDKNLPFQKIAEEDAGSMTPGPGSRTKEVTNLYEEYRNAYLASDGDASEGLSESEYLEDVIANAYEYTKAPIVEVDSITDGPNGKVVAVHCYEEVDDGGGMSHTATWNWIYYDVETGVYTDFFGNELSF